MQKTRVQNGSGLEEPTESFIEGSTSGRIKNAEFKECKVTNPATCHITAEAIKLEEATLTGELVGPNTDVKFTPTGTKFATFTFKNESTCGVLKGKEIVVKGETKGVLDKPGECLQSHKLTIAEKPTTTLTAAGATIEEFELELEPEGLESVEGHTAESDICWDLK